MVDREEHIKLSDEFFDKAIELIQSNRRVDIALASECLLLSFDHLIEAYLAYLGKLQIGRRWRFERFKFEVIDQNTYVHDESERISIWKTIVHVHGIRDLLIYARDKKLYEIEEAKDIIKEVIENVKICRDILKDKVL